MHDDKLNSRAVIFFSLGILAAFPWYYDYPMNSDIPMHAAAAKALVDLLAGPVAPGYPYALNLKIASYAAPEAALAGLVWLFGVTAGAKAALSIYAAAFSYTLYRLMSVLGEGRSALPLLAFPLGLSYYFHMGFWPFMVGQVLLNVTLLHHHAVQRPRPLTRSLLRLAVFLCHPMPALVIGVHDLVMFYPSVRRDRAGKTAWQYAQAIIICWWPALLLLIYMLSLVGGARQSMFVYGTWLEQLRGVLRPPLLFGTNYEMALNYLPILLLLVGSFRLRGSGVNRRLLALGYLLGAIGAAIPREAFIGSWDNGGRVSLYGLIFIVSSLHYCRRHAIYVYSWIAALFIYNVTASAVAWGRIAPDFDAFIVWAKGAGVERLVKAPGRTDDLPVPMGLGNNVHLWAWCLGTVRDASTPLTHNYGPVRYRALNSERVAFVYYGVPPEEALNRTILLETRAYTVAASHQRQ
jgi:hypothetical protein